ncbi:MAG TPA: hypothetical protein DCY27_01325 [Desulfobacterales bacterium]|nr:hypothetical protein [Desulfobacterales bacterium]
MVYKEYQPHPSLTNHITCYWTLTESVGLPPAATRHFLTEGGGFSFNLADTPECGNSDPPLATLRQSCLCGPLTEPMRLQLIGRIRLFGVRFRPGGSYPFIPYPPADLVNFHGEINDFGGGQSRSLINEIRDGCRSVQDRIGYLNRYLYQYLEKSPKEIPEIALALDIIDKVKGQVDIHRLAKSVGLSTRQLERRFKERIGMSPKQLCRNLRFKNILKYLAESVADSWVDAALTCGYYDQAHMIRDFKHYTGASPGRYFSQPNRLKVAATSIF